ncbi:MAG TPA: single-stranded-DNA-specific exonuclease RecJ, partial [Fusobacteria bacterium]|nr:single-stranded-DNA-specific exonuclease RecJ [Fusobacteriota bacterium]
MKNTIWSQIESDDKAAANLASGMGISPVLANLLVQRNVKTKSEAIKFLNPSIKNICNPFKLKDMAKAVSRIEKAISNDEKIFIYGDYDVDGITSSATLVNGLRKIGANVDYFIPSRDEGYGLNSDAIEKISTKSKLIITVDCGISSFDEIECAKELGVDIIVTDHHEIKDIPKAFAVINPKREDNAYKFKNLAGVGTAFMLLYAIYKSLNQDLDFLFSLLDLVAIGTISDVVPLISENRIFVKHGLNIIKRSQNVGIQTINDNLFPEKEITSMDVGFKIAPLFNAAGRLEHAGQVVEFLTTKDRSRAQKIFDYLVQLNLKRKEIGKDMLENADKKASDQDSVIIVYSTEFHQGLVGIIAARLVDKYNVPAIVLKVKEDGTATGSARSIEGFNIVSAFQKCEDILIKFGGHSKAAGLTIDSTKLPEFAGRIKEIFSNEVKDNKKEIKISSSLQDFSVSIDLCQSVNRLRPFGYGNPEPLFLLEDVSLVNVKKIGKNGDHLMFDLIGRNRIKNAVWFKNSELIHKIETGKKYDIVFKIEENFFNGRISPKVYAEDIKENRRKKCSIKYYRDLHGVKLPLNASFTSTFPIREGTEIKDSESYFFFEGIRVNLNDELQHLLRELQQNYFFKFKLKVTKSEQRDEYY